MRAYPSVTAHVIGADGALIGFGAGLEWNRAFSARLCRR